MTNDRLARARAAVEADRTKAYGWRELARAEAEAGDMGAAAEAQQRYVDLQAADARAFVFPSDLIRLGDLRAETGDTEAAAAAYQQAGEVRTHDEETEQVEALMRLGALRRHTGDPAAALDAYAEVVRRGDHHWGEAQAETGRILRDTEVTFEPMRWRYETREEAVVGAWRGARVADDPTTRAEAFAEHGKALAEQGSVDEAVESLQKAVALGDATWSPVAQTRLDDLVATTGREAPGPAQFTPEELSRIDPDAAVTAFAALAHGPDRRQARYAAWQAHGIRMHQGLPGDAVRLAQLAITLDDHGAMTNGRFDRLAWALADAGRPEEALLALDQAIEEDNQLDEWESEVVRAEQLAALGRGEEAAEARDRAQGLWSGQGRTEEHLLIGHQAELMTGAMTVFVPGDPEASAIRTAAAERRQAEALARVGEVLAATGWQAPSPAGPDGPSPAPHPPAAPPASSPPPPPPASTPPASGGRGEQPDRPGLLGRIGRWLTGS